MQKVIIKSILVAFGSAIVLSSLSGVILDAAYIVAEGLEGLAAHNYINGQLYLVAFQSFVGFLIIALRIYAIPEISDRSGTSEE